MHNDCCSVVGLQERVVSKVEGERLAARFKLELMEVMYYVLVYGIDVKVYVYCTCIDKC